MSRTGKKNYRHNLGNKLKKITISQLRQKQLDCEQEYQQLINEINEYYNSLIESIQQEREQIMMELEKVFSIKTSEVKNRIDSNEIATFPDSQSTPFLEYFFKKVHYPIADFNSHAFLLNHRFLAEENIVQKSILDGIDKYFIRATKHLGEYYYLTSDMNNLLYKNGNLELCYAIPMRVVQRQKPPHGASKGVSDRKWDAVLPQDKSIDWDNAVQSSWDAAEPLEPADIGWGVSPTQLDTGWDAPVVESWGAPQDKSDDWDNAVQWNAPEPLEPADNEWGLSSTQLSTGWDTPVFESRAVTPTVPPSNHDRPFDFVMTQHYVFVTFEISKEIGTYLLTDRLSNMNSISNKLLSQPRGICMLEDNVNLIFIADLDSKKVCAFAINDFINSAVNYADEFKCEFTVQFGESENPLLLHKNDTKREILILTLSNTIYIMSATGSVLHKLAYTEFISPYDMKVVKGGKIMIVDLESLVILDANGACMSKYFSDKFSYRSCINCTEDCVEVITRLKDMEYVGVENIEICLL